MPTVQLRSMTHPDLPAVMDAQESGAVLGLAEVFPQDEHPFPRDVVASRWHEEIDTAGIDCLVVEEDGEVVGFAALRGDELMHFGVAPGRWGTGTAGAALDALLDRMVAAGVGRAWLRVFTGNGRGRRFYEKHGWTPTGERTHTAFPPRPELLTYERDLSDRAR